MPDMDRLCLQATLSQLALIALFPPETFSRLVMVCCLAAVREMVYAVECRAVEITDVRKTSVNYKKGEKK
jgi:hypothetical protein